MNPKQIPLYVITIEPSILIFYNNLLNPAKAIAEIKKRLLLKRVKR
ncbi:MAG: hypothetical protein AABY79_02445 [Nitrospirota bacterium]